MKISPKLLPQDLQKRLRDFSSWIILLTSPKNPMEIPIDILSRNSFKILKLVHPASGRVVYSVHARQKEKHTCGI